MKKLLALLLSIVVICTSFAACSSDKKEEEGTEGTSVSEKAKAESTTNKPQTNPAAIPTEKAVIKEADAADFIKEAYTEKELGLEKVEDNYSFMVAQSGAEIEGKKYIKVAANVMSQNEEKSADGKVTYSLTPVGEYYISFDGKTVLMRDMKTKKYKELENRYEKYKADAKKADDKSKKN